MGFWGKKDLCLSVLICQAYANYICKMRWLNVLYFHFLYHLLDKIQKTQSWWPKNFILVSDLFWFVTDVTHLVSRRALNEEAMPITIAKSASSSAHCRKYHRRQVLVVSLTPLPPESNSTQCRHGRRYLVCLYRTGFLGLHHNWVKAGLQCLAILDSKVAQPL